jgi:altronate dehydratase
MKKREKVILLDEKDNVVTALTTLHKGEKFILKLSGKTIGITVKNDIPFGHKIAINKIRSGEDIIKYGWPIGTATKNIDVGEHVHIHNVSSRRGIP